MISRDAWTGCSNALRTRITCFWLMLRERVIKDKEDGRHKNNDDLAAVCPDRVRAELRRLVDRRRTVAAAWLAAQTGHGAYPLIWPVTIIIVVVIESGLG